MAYMKHMGSLIVGGSIGVPDYTKGENIGWIKTTKPYPMMIKLNGGGPKEIKAQVTITKDGWVIGRLGASEFSVNGIYVNQGQDSFNGEGCFPVKVGDVVGCSDASPNTNMYFFPAIGGGGVS